MSLRGRKILLGVTGGIAAYKTPELVRLLTKAGAAVKVMMTQSASHFVTPLTLETVSSQSVISSLWEGDFVATRHIDWAEWPDLILLAPATANVIGKLSSGISDDFVTTVACASQKPLMLAPAMNPVMWQNPTVQRNFNYLLSQGVLAIDPDQGEMACESVGVGRMAEPEAIAKKLELYFAARSKPNSLAGKRIVVTAGPTREAIDPVRFISNRSSGKMGFAIADAAQLAGAQTTLISGPTSLLPPAGVKTISIESVSELLNAVRKGFATTDCLVMAAAPADYIPKSVSPRKLKKSAQATQLDLVPAVDILETLAKTRSKSQRVVGFALETELGEANARKKLLAKGLDLIVLNSLEDEGAGFQHDTNKLTLIYRDGHSVAWPLMSKKEAGDRLVNEVIASLL